jgi:LAO/AO transport system kinase
MTGTPARAVPKQRKLKLEQYLAGIRARDRMVLGRAITLVESNNVADQKLAQELLLALLPETGKAQRVGITGVPGVGKSTFIDALGTQLTSAGQRVAVLAVDPTSGITGGSILGDKTRMARLASDERAFVRPSPSSGSLGGVTRKTRESMLVCEAAGFDVVLVETVGVGQSETVVAEMVDFFLVLMLPGAGDELQGIKRGILELADMVAINKADANPQAARVAKRDYLSALRVMRAGDAEAGYLAKVLTISAKTGQGLPQLWDEVQRHRAAMLASGRLSERRRAQLLRWTWSMVESRVLQALHSHAEVARRVPALEAEILAGKITPTLGARAILEAFGIEP